MDFLNALPTVLANIVQDYDKDTENHGYMITELEEMIGPHIIETKTTPRMRQVKFACWMRNIREAKAWDEEDW